MLRRFSISRSISTRRRFRSAVVALTSLLANSCSTSERTISRLASRARWHPSATNPLRMSTVDNLTSSKTTIHISRSSKSGNERDEPGHTTRLRCTRLLRRLGLQHLICPQVKCTGSANTVESLGEKRLHFKFAAWALASAASSSESMTNPPSTSRTTTSAAASVMPFQEFRDRILDLSCIALELRNHLSAMIPKPVRRRSIHRL